MRTPSKPRKRKNATDASVGKIASRLRAGMLLDRHRFLLGERQFVAFVRALDAAPPAGQNLKRLMQRRPLWKRARVARER